jgi:hypothetical protein
VVRAMLDKAEPEYRRFPCATPMWDNTARRGKSAIMLLGSTPEKYERWLSEVVRRECGAHPKDPIVFINAWNEWAEGCHLEPDLKHGTAYLEATRRALALQA